MPSIDDLIAQQERKHKRLGSLTKPLAPIASPEKKKRKLKLFRRKKKI